MSSPPPITPLTLAPAPAAQPSLWSTLRVRTIGLVGITLLSMINLTLRWRRIGHAADPELLSGVRPPKIVTFWHGSQLFMAFAARHALRKASGSPRPRMHTLISAHSDGRIIAFATRLLGLNSIAGSSTRGGSEAVAQLVSCLSQGSHICITPDGPKGPLYKAKKGAVVIASKTGLAIWPAACAASSCWRLSSWDRMFIPKPFSRLVLNFGEPLTVPAQLDEAAVDHYCQELEGRINATQKQAEEELQRLEERKTTHDA